MKQYPSIPREISSEEIYAFDKLDGSNIRAEWTRKDGFIQFGTKKKMLTESDPRFGMAIPLIIDNYLDWMNELGKKHKWKRQYFSLSYTEKTVLLGFSQKIKIQQ